MRTLQTQAEWCNRAQWTLGLSLAVMVVGFYAFIYRPQTQRQQDLRAQINTKVMNLTTNKTRAQVLPAVLDSVRNKKEALRYFDKQIPSRPDSGAFIHDITEMSHQAGLQSKWAVDPGLPLPQTGDHYAEWPIALKFEGNFLNVCSFLQMTEHMTRLTSVKGLKIKASNSGKAGQVQVELSMSIYFLEG